MPFFHSRGMKLHYETAGSGLPILMIHGFTNHGMVWAEQIADLVHAGYRVIMPDLAGHGLSQLAEKTTTVEDLTLDMVNLLDHLGIDRTSVCGLSLGGMVGQYLAADHPARIDALIVANSCVDSTAPDVVAASESWIEMFEQPNGPLLRMQAVWPQMLNERYRAQPDGGGVSRQLEAHQRQDSGLLFCQRRTRAAAVQKRRPAAEGLGAYPGHQQ